MNHTANVGDSTEQGYPDQYLPLHHPDVLRSTGVCAKTLKIAIEENAMAYGSGVVQKHYVKGKTLLRFNPYKHIQSISGEITWQDNHQEQKHTSEETGGGHGEPTDQEEKSTKLCATSMETPWKNTIHHPKLTLQQPNNMRTGAALLRNLAQARQKNRK